MASLVGEGRIEPGVGQVGEVFQALVLALLGLWLEGLAIDCKRRQM